MSRIRLYFDEDTMQHGLIAALRARRIVVMTASEAQMVGRSDEEHLSWAAQEGFVLYTFNIGDYSSLHQEWLAAGQVHNGIVLGRQQRYPVGEQLRRLLTRAHKRSAEDMRGRLEYLSAWGR